LSLAKVLGKDRDVVGYSLPVNTVPLQAELLGANPHESYWVFDLCYNNTQDIVPTIIPGDMHSLKKANLSILDFFWDGLRVAFHRSTGSAQTSTAAPAIQNCIPAS